MADWEPPSCENRNNKSEIQYHRKSLRAKENGQQLISRHTKQLCMRQKRFRISF